MRINKLDLGVTLVELIVVISIIALLALVGFPSYQTYLMESRRSDAINTLRENQLLIENYMHLNDITPTDTDVTIITASPAGFYDIAYTRVNDDRYKLVATAVSTKSQNNDTACTTITLVSEMDSVYPAECN